MRFLLCSLVVALVSAMAIHKRRERVKHLLRVQHMAIQSPQLALQQKPSIPLFWTTAAIYARQGEGSKGPSERN